MRNLLLAALFILSIQDSAQGWWIQAFPISGETFWQDTAGPDVPRGGYRLTFNQRIFLANGNTLYINPSQFPNYTWRAFTHSPARQTYPFRAPAPLAAGKTTNPLVLWGNWRSRNNGDSWQPLPFPSDRFLVYGIGEHGICLGGGSGETIDRSLDSGRTWKQVYKGDDSGYVRQLQFWDSSWAFAALHPARILVSRDGGATWTSWPHAPEFSGPGFRIQDMAIIPVPVSDDWYAPMTLHLWTLHVETRTGKTHLLRNLIDSNRTLEFKEGLPETTLTRMSSYGNSLAVSSGRRVYSSYPAGGRFIPAGDLAELPKGEELLELHGSGNNYATFAVTRKGVLGSYYETGVGRGAERSENRAPARHPPGILSGRGDGDFTGAYRADGRIHAPPFDGTGVRR
jgi:hypothetical protein